MLMRIFGPKRDEATGGWRKMHVEHHNLYSPNIIKLIKSRKIGWVEHVTSIWEKSFGRKG
jgi:hypothetical protein